MLRELAEEVSARIKLPVDEIKSALLTGAGSPTLRKTVRKFGGFPETCYFSLSLRTVSVESLLWVVRSIRNDCMRPSESLVHSRLKECYDLSIRKEWKGFVEALSKSAKLSTKINKFQHLLSPLNIISAPKKSLLFELEEKWNYLDDHEESQDSPEFLAFLTFIEEYFLALEQAEKPGLKCQETKNQAIPGGKYGCALLVKT